MFRYALSAATVLFALVPALRADVSDDFDGGPNGWTMAVTPASAAGNDGFTAPATGGNGGGFLQITHTFNFANPSDPSYAAPAAYLGDKSSYYGLGSLNFDYFPGYQTSLPNGVGRVQLDGNGTTLLYTFTLPSIGQQWYHVTIPLNVNDLNWTIGGTSNHPVAGDFQNALANLDEVWIDGINGAGPQTTGIDNVVLRAAPEPASLVCLSMAGAMLLKRRR